jgi:hypothetical protein
MSRFPESPQSADLDAPFGVDEPSHIHIARPSRRADASDYLGANGALLADACRDAADD